MKTLAACLLAIIVLAGCGESLEKKVVGNWKADTAKSSISGDKVKSEADKKMAMAMLGTFALELKADKTFTMTVVFPVTGTWALTGNKLTITPTLKEGESMSFGGKTTMDFDVDASGTSMTSTMDDDGMKGTLVMTKSDAGK